jgi:hypothetical protein
MNQSLAQNPARPTRPAHLDPRDLARRVVALVTLAAAIAGVLAGRPMLPVLSRASVVCIGGIVLIACGEAIVRRARRRVVR